jgi:hypothetical protein
MTIASLRHLSLALPALALVATGCDSYSNDTVGNVIDVVSFSMDVDDAIISADGFTATFASDDVQDDTAQNLIEEILDESNVTTDGLVMLYAEDDLFIGPSSGSVTRWAALPYTEGFENVLIDGTPYVDLTLTYTYSFDAGDPGTVDDGNLYFDVVSSAASVDFVTFLRDRLQGDRIRLKLVAIPRQLFDDSGLRAGDLNNFETVRRTFNLAAE